MPAPRPRRRFGQNFLIDRGVVARIVAELSPADGEPVLEIGPGRGALTERILERTARLAAVEIDLDLAALLESTLGPRGLRLRRASVLDVDWVELAAALDLGPEDRFAVVGNLPYNLSKPIALRLVDERLRLSRAVLMFQREVAQRLAARPGTRAYAPLTILVGRHFRVERAFDVPPSAFRPRPKVHSTVTRWTPREEIERRADDERFRSVLRSCFARRRRTLANNVRNALSVDDRAARALLRSADLDPDHRAEVVPPEGFERLASLWPADAVERRR